jgi:putative transposase
MARPLRLEFPGAIYHVTSRGNALLPIFEVKQDRQSFLALLQEVVKRFNWLCHAYCLMDNHYHVLVGTVDGNLSMGMRHLNGVYTQRFNRHHNRVGHVFQGRYKSILVDRDSYLLELCRYVVLNPVRAKMVREPGKYPWSSYRPTAGLVKRPSLLTLDWVLGQFADKRAGSSRAIQAVRIGRYR